MGKQNGFGMVSCVNLLLWLWVLIFVMKLMPLYWEHYLVVTAVEKSIKHMEVGKQDPVAVMDAINRGLLMNNVKNLGPDNFTIKIVDQKPQVTLNYFEEKPMMFNISLMVKFNDEFKSK